jgi:hypothetical protein
MNLGDLVYDDSIGLIGIIIGVSTEGYSRVEMYDVLFQPVFSGEVFIAEAFPKDLTIISET